MANPFEKRATEYLRDDEAFLALVTPEPLATFFQKPAEEGKLYDRLAMIIGTPGSGKTTMARLFQYATLRTLLRNQDADTYKPLLDILTECGAIENNSPVIVGARLPLETEYREFWEFPYPDELKTGLMITLLQARAVLAWLRDLQAAGISLANVVVVPRADAEAALSAIGGVNAQKLLDRAREVEKHIYQISAALIPPDIDSINSDVTSAYRPFDVIERLNINHNGNIEQLRPLVIFDDAHRLHPLQFFALKRWLTRRELRVSRWILTRLDALTPADVLLDNIPIEATDEPGLKPSREITEIKMQNGDQRGQQRKAFRKMAKDMASRYMGQMEVFSRRRLNILENLLSTEPESISASKVEKLSEHVEKLEKRYKITNKRRKIFEEEIDRYLEIAGDKRKDIKLSMLSIFCERYAKRLPQRSLFESEISEDLEPNKPIIADSGILDGARIHLLHKYDRPYYFGIDTLCDASSENAEQFLQLSARLVSQLETQLIRTKSATLNSGLQHKLLRERTTEMIRQWDFPHHQSVKRLADGIAEHCRAKSMEGNASLEGGANAFGILQEEFESIPEKHPALAQVLQFGIAYNAFVLVPNYGTKKRLWCLIELGGILSINYGLTLKRGGFLERRTDDLARFLVEG